MAHAGHRRDREASELDRTRGLTNDEAARRLEVHGPNRLEQARGRTAFAILLGQLKSLIVLLVAATGLAFATGEPMEAGAILVVIVLNATIGFLTEWKAEQKLTALQKQTVRIAHVVRDGDGDGDGDGSNLGYGNCGGAR